MTHKQVGAIYQVLLKHSSGASCAKPEGRHWIGNNTVLSVTREIVQALEKLEKKG